MLGLKYHFPATTMSDSLRKLDVRLPAQKYRHQFIFFIIDGLILHVCFDYHVDWLWQVACSLLHCCRMAARWRGLFMSRSARVNGKKGESLQYPESKFSKI
ncbi:hypothetical protein SEVIR_2G136301v4 [Setaria viridis]